jgi:hypothetical protein
LRDNFSLAVAATVSILSFGIVILFVTVGILESNTQEIKLQELDKLFNNTTEIAKETQNATKHQLLQFFNKTSDTIMNNPELQRLQQQWETVNNSTRSKP